MHDRGRGGRTGQAHRPTVGRGGGTLFLLVIASGGPLQEVVSRERAGSRELHVAQPVAAGEPLPCLLHFLLNVLSPVGTARGRRGQVVAGPSPLLRGVTGRQLRLAHVFGDGGRAGIEGGAGTCPPALGALLVAGGQRH